MVGMYGINGIPEPASPNGAQGRGTRRVTSGQTAGRGQDSVTISSQALGASRVRETSQSAADDLRAERIAQARQAIEQGTHRVQNVVRIVAARVSRYLAAQER